MYNYRRMTDEERAAVVAERQARGFPLHKPPHLNQGSGWYLITAATYEHRKLFDAPAELRALELRLLEAFTTTGTACAGWVVLPNHYHALVRTESLADVGKALGRVHGRSSRYVNLRDGTPGRTVWYKFSDRKMRSDEHFWATLHYVIHNPVKHGYVDTADQWPWSCVTELVAERGAAWLQELTESYPLGAYGDKWDV